MEYEFFGHAIPSFGYKVTFNTLRNAWCELNIKQSDLAILKEISRLRDWRVANGADDLLRLYYQVNNLDQEDKTSVFNPTNPSYILRDGCTNE